MPASTNQLFTMEKRKKGKKATADSGQNLATCSYKRDWAFDALLLCERQAKEKGG